MRHNWVEEFLTETSWSTQVSASDEDQTEERIGLWDRPQRSILMKLNGSRLEPTEMSRTYLQMMQYAERTLPTPIIADRTVNEGTIGQGTVDVQCDTTYKRFFPGMRVAFVHPQYEPLTVSSVLTDAYTVAISEMTTDGFRLAEPSLISIPEGYYIFPMMDVEPVFKMGGVALSDRFVSYSAEYMELPGASSIPSSWPLGSDIESKFKYYDGRPIFNFRPDAVSNPRIQYLRAGGRTSSGRGSYFYTRGSKAFITQDFIITTKTRQDSWRLLEFMDWAMGRLKTFWIRNAHIYWRYEDGVISQTSGSSLTFDVSFSRNAIEDFFEHLFIQYTDGTQQIVQVVTTSSPSIDKIQFNFTEATEQTVDKIKFVTTAHIVRNSQDVFKQSWITDTVATSYISVREVVDEDTNVVIS